MGMKFYELTKQQYSDINAIAPSDIKFGFESHGRHYISDHQLDDLEEKFGGLLNLTLQNIIGKDLTAFRTENESVVYEQYKTQKDKNTAGFDAYEKMFGLINANGGLGSSIDNDMIPAYSQLTQIRMMLKDGAFEMALRYWVTEISTLNLLDQDVADECVVIIEDLCIDYGTNQAVIDAIKTAPKGSL
jgi:hypothetical protein